MNQKIDFVIPWVDGNDTDWLKEKEKYQADSKSDNSNFRYRDWENLQYWFRGVEEYAPWVNKIFFVTWGHIPKWLNINNPKLEIIKHEDYIPKEYLPTFSSHTIELNLHRIKNLSENFVYFNDDTFLINKTKETDFFEKGFPKDSACLYPNIPKGNLIDNIITNDIAIINNHFESKAVLKSGWKKWFTLKNGKYLYNNIFLYPFYNFSGINFTHLPNSFNKSSFEKVWSEEFEKLDETCSHKFRNAMDVNQWVVRCWQICENNISPRSIKWGYYYKYGNTKDNLEKLLLSSKYKAICLNDVSNEYNFEEEKEKTIKIFEKKFPKKSSFEI